MAGKQQVVEDIAITSENREEVITKYSPMIKYVANRIAMRLPPHVEVDDLISVGVLGLMDAITKYDPTRGAKFKTYAEFRVRGAILDELRSMDWVPRSVRQKASNVDAVVKKLEGKLRRKPEDEEALSQLKDIAPSPAEVAEQNELKTLIQQQLAGMDVAQREIVLLRDFHDLSYAEIAEVMEIRAGTVMSRLHRARKELRQRMRRCL